VVAHVLLVREMTEDPPGTITRYCETPYEAMSEFLKFLEANRGQVQRINMLRKSCKVGDKVHRFLAPKTFWGPYA